MKPGTGSKNKPNRLIHEKSPYLLQHAHNPVDWYPWTDEAFDRAANEDKPVFLSIGYSTCHWCHVMEHESFEDQEVANILNKYFVCIKVDREERPDIDSVYMTVCQLLTGSGGWPLTLILDPGKKPFFAGTYFPKETKWGRIGLLELLSKVVDAWNDNRNALISSAGEIVANLQRELYEPTGYELKEDVLDKGYESLHASYDKTHGGFGSSPKFPIAHNLLFLLRYWKKSGKREALSMTEKTLSEMYNGGIYDHLGFGFHRYSTDSRWLVPHFEKMLYDQAVISLAYTEAYQAVKKDLYKKAAEETLLYVQRTLTSQEGGFYSAEDADSEGEEGKYYVWTAEELRHAAGDDAQFLFDVYNVLDKGNFMEEIHQENGHSIKSANILHRTSNISSVIKKYGLTDETFEEKLDLLREKLYVFREKRLRPNLDDKILTDWNGLMIASFARASVVFGKKDYYDIAVKAATFIDSNLTDKRKLLHRYRDGEAGLQANIDDYMFYIWGLTELYEAGFEAKYLIHAVDLMNYAIEHFWDSSKGGFYQTPDDGESLPARLTEIYDGAIPSGNSIALLNLSRMAKFTGDTNYEDQADMLLARFSETVNLSPSAYTMFLSALSFVLGPSYEVLITGKRGSHDVRAMFEALRNEYIPNKVVLFKPDGEESDVTIVSRFNRHQEAVEGKATAYVCRNFACERPV